MCEVHSSCWMSQWFILFLMSSFQLYEGTTVYLPIHLLEDIGIISRFGSLQIRLWMFMYRLLYDHKFPFLWNKYPKVQLLDHMVSTSFLRNWTTMILFRVVLHFTFWLACVNGQIFYITASIWYYHFKKIVIHWGM